MADNKDSSNVENSELNLKEFDCVNSTTVKVSKAWANDLVENLKEQFRGINNTLTDLKLNVCRKNDILQMENRVLSTISEVSNTVSTVKSMAMENSSAIQELRSEMMDLKRECADLKNENSILKKQCNNIETYTRKDNIIFHGIQETDQETNEQCVGAVRAFMRNTLNINCDVVDNIRFVRCHRMKGDRNFARPVIARFREYSEREMVWGKITQLRKNSKFFMSEDYPKSVVFNRKKLRPIFNRARNTIGKKEVSLKSDQLTISGKLYSVSNLMELEGDLHPRCFSRRSSKEVLVFGGALSEYEYLSNWGKYPVTHNGTTYATLEHGFMHMKCLINGDVASAQAVLRSSEPYMAKQFGGKVKVDRHIWTSSKSEKVMADLLRVKFSSGSVLARELLDTGDKYLAESGRDLIYACGLPITHKDILNRSAHTGKNRLGHLLMEIRHSLRQAV